MYDRLEQSGFGIGQRVIELISCRDRLFKRETRIVNMLQVRIVEMISFARSKFALSNPFPSTFQAWCGSISLIKLQTTWSGLLRMRTNVSIFYVFLE